MTNQLHEDEAQGEARRSTVHTEMSTGLPHLDRVLKGILPGDNIVWQVDSIDNYLPFIEPFVTASIRAGRQVTYFRFAEHPPLVPKQNGVAIYELNPQEGFENFISEIFDVIEKYGVGACYIFDCLSDLSADWYSDRMLGNFFMLTCPYLYDFDTATYFGLLRNHHMADPINAIHTTAQVVIDVYQNRQMLYIHPLKVWKRHSPTMYMLHSWDGDKFVPVTSSAITSEILGSVPQPWLDFSIQPTDIWTRDFTRAQQLERDIAQGNDRSRESDELFERLLRMVVTRDDRLLSLARKYLSLTDLVGIGKRMIGTGLIGGKSVGMLISRAIIAKESPSLNELLESHDSFFIGSDVFYTYLVRNKCWWIRRKLKQSKTILDRAEDVRQRLLSGTFPDEIRLQFEQMLNYFGQSPIIVRSSSLLEDAYGNAFSGKYESVFCANQGTPAERLEAFMDAIRTVYASTMSQEALAYRSHWNLLDLDEQMALLVQRVSGQMYGSYYFPQAAGVGFSYNPYVWSSDIDPTQGVLRLVFGLGTRAVDRSDDDYTRVVAINAPLKRPEATRDEVRKFTQRKVDVIDLSENCQKSCEFEQAVAEAEGFPLETFASRDKEIERRAMERGMSSVFPYILTFDTMLSKTGFIEAMRKMLAILHGAYKHAVDIEFTANFLSGSVFRINLLQCRPFQVKHQHLAVPMPSSVDPSRIVLKTSGPLIGNSRNMTVRRLIYVVPSAYSLLNMAGRYSIARLVGKLTHLDEEGGILLLGPGRWGTSTPSLGVPVSFAEIDTVSVMCEIAEMHEGLVPDVSLGTHFFNDLVEMDMMYMAIYPDRAGTTLNSDLLLRAPNHLADFVPDASTWTGCVWVIQGEDFGEGKELRLSVNAMSQEGILYIADIGAQDSPSPGAKDRGGHMPIPEEAASTAASKAGTGKMEGEVQQ
jgi:pyruvate, water dikinase